MPNYEFEYTDASGEQHRFEQWVAADRQDLVAAMKSPCGQYEAHRVWTCTPVHHGMTAREKVSGTTKYRKEFSSFARQQRSERKKNAEPGTKDSISNELWTGTESFTNVLSAKPAGAPAPSVE
ncbi:MAG: hypothetical protein JSS66_04895 [Armatimonadetes bacterium]|nr:hypothetical protein [Armatimonadota bacterium]